MPNKKNNRVTLVRNLIIGGLGLLIALVVGYGLLYSTGVTQGEFEAGTHYTVLENTERRRPGAPIEVREYFSYGCIHCRNLDPLLEEWQQTLADDVSFTRTPVAFSPPWILLAQTYFTLEQLDILEQNHERIFRRIHDNRRMFQSPEEIAEFVDGNGATSDEFLDTFNGPDVRRALRQSDNQQRRVGISAVPTLVVDGRYVVTMDVGQRVALEVVNHLIELERNPSGAATPEPAGS